MKTIFWNVKDAFMSKQLVTKFLPLTAGMVGIVFGGYFGLQNLLTSNVYYD
jgi:hypothetical protein